MIYVRVFVQVELMCCPMEFPSRGYRVVRCRAWARAYVICGTKHGRDRLRLDPRARACIQIGASYEDEDVLLASRRPAHHTCKSDMCIERGVTSSVNGKFHGIKEMLHVTSETRKEKSQSCDVICIRLPHQLYMWARRVCLAKLTMLALVPATCS